MGNRKKRKKKIQKIKRTEVLQLFPKDVYQEREASIENINILIRESPNPHFVEQAIQLRDSMMPGDRLFEFCSSIECWQQYIGTAGFIVKRGNEIVKSLMCKMN